MRILSLETHALLVRNKMKLVTFEKYCNNCYNPLFTSLCSRWQPNARASHNYFFLFHGTALWNVMILQKMNGSL